MIFSIYRRAALSCLVIALAATAASASWPGLRGPAHDGAVRDARLFSDASGALEVVWKRPLGSGYSMVVTDGERLVTAFQDGENDVVAAFELASGDEIWRTPLGSAHAGHTGSHDGPIATPAIADGRVFALGPQGILIGLSAADGTELWRLHLVDDLEAEPPYYGFSTSPVIVGDAVVVEVGAGAGKTFAAFAAASGELLWSAGDDAVAYQSPIVTTIAGVEQIVAVGQKTVVGLAPATGEVLWSHEHGGDERAMGGETIVPVPAGGGRILLLNQQPSTVMLRVARDGEAWAVEELWTTTNLKGTYVQPVVHDDVIYGMNGKIFAALDAANGETLWRSREAGDGFPTLVGDQLVIMNKAGVLKVAEASRDGYREVTRLELFDQLSWSAPTFHDGHLYLRSFGSLARVDPVAAATAEVAGETTVAASGFPAFVQRLADEPDPAAAIDAYLESHPSPIVDDDGSVHFVYRGEAEDVGIVGDMIGNRREDPLTRVDGTDLFYYSTVLEPDAAVHYGFIVDFGEPTSDPGNPRTADGIFGELSWFTMPARVEPSFLGEAEPSRRGKLDDLAWTSEAKEGEARTAKVYLPAGYDESDRRYPVLYVYAGADALEEGSMRQALDNLLGSSVAPIVAVFILPPEEEPRADMRGEAFLQMVTRELVPLVDSRYRTVADRTARGVFGAGGAGNVALTTAAEHGDVFGRAAILWPPRFGRVIGEVPDFGDRQLVVYHAWGTYHIVTPHERFDARQANRDLWAGMREQGLRPSGGEVPEGFGWATWQAYLDDALRALFPPR